MAAPFYVASYRKSSSNGLAKPYHGLLVGALAALSLFGQTIRQPVFASTAQLDVASVLPKPPAHDSAQTAAELAELHVLQDTRSPAQIAHARDDEAELDIFIFRDVLGKKFTRQALPVTAYPTT